MKKLFRTYAALTLSAVLTVSSMSVMAADEVSKFFVDVNESSYGWAAGYIDYLAANNIASGVGDAKFAPGTDIERGDFVVFLNKTFSFPNGDGFIFQFKDVKVDSYYYEAITNAKAAGAIPDENMFYPETAIKRIDAFVMLYRALNYGNYVKNNATTDISMYSDADEIKSTIQQLSVGTLTQMGIVQGSGGILNPDATMTRAEMAVIIAKTAQLIETAKEEALKPVEKTEEEIKAEEEKKEQEAEQAKAEETRDHNGETISEPIIVKNGGTVSITDSNAETKGKDAVTSLNNSNVNIEKSSVFAQDASALYAAGGDMSVKDSTIGTENGYALSVSDKSEVSVEDSKLSAKGVRNTVNVNNAILEIEDSKITADKERSAFSLADGARLKLTDSEVTADCASAAGAYEGIISAISDPDKNDEITVDFENVKLDNSKGALLYARESDVTINFKGKNTIKVSKLVYSPFLLKKDQQKGNKIVINTEKNQNFDNVSIEIDGKTSLALNLASGCNYSGYINTGGTSKDVDLNIDADATLTILGDMYIDSFYDGDVDLYNINDNGFTIYYNVGNPENDYLGGREYDLVYGGRLVPMDF